MQEPSQQQIHLILDGLDYLSQISCYKAMKYLVDKSQDGISIDFFTLKPQSLDMEIIVNCHESICNWISISHSTFSLCIDYNRNGTTTITFNENRVHWDWLRPNPVFAHCSKIISEMRLTPCSH